MPVMSLMHKPSALLVALSFATLLGTPRELRAQHIEVDARLLSTLLWIELGVQ